MALAVPLCLNAAAGLARARRSRGPSGLCLWLCQAVPPCSARSLSASAAPKGLPKGLAASGALWAIPLIYAGHWAGPRLTPHCELRPLPAHGLRGRVVAEYTFPGNVYVNSCATTLVWLAHRPVASRTLEVAPPGQTVRFRLMRPKSAAAKI